VAVIYALNFINSHANIYIYSSTHSSTHTYIHTVGQKGRPRKDIDDIVRVDETVGVLHKKQKTAKNEIKTLIEDDNSGDIPCNEALVQKAIRDANVTPKEAEVIVQEVMSENSGELRKAKITMENVVKEKYPDKDDAKSVATSEVRSLLITYYDSCNVFLFTDAFYEVQNWSGFVLCDVT
jgi:hypothetical protein